MITLSSDIKPFSRLMDRAWMRDKNSGIVYTGEQLVLAMLLKSKKKRDPKQEQELKEVLGVKE